MPPEDDYMENLMKALRTKKPIRYSPTHTEEVEAVIEDGEVVGIMIHERMTFEEYEKKYGVVIFRPKND